MALPESNGGAPAQAPSQNKPTAKTAVLDRNPGSGTGDLSAAFDFYGQSGADVPATIEDNDPNVGWEGPAEGEEDGATEEEFDPDAEETNPEDGSEVVEEEAAEGEEDGDTEESDEEEGEGTEEEAPKPKKVAKLYIGDKEHDVPLDATIPTTVNGEVENPTLQDLRNAYSSRASIRKDVEIAKAAREELDTHRRQMVRKLEKKEVDLMDREYRNSRAQEALKAGRYEEALNELFEFDHEKWDKFDEIMMGYYPDFAKLDAPTRRSLQLDRQNKMMEKRSARATEAAAMQRGIDAFENYKKVSCERTGLKEEDVENAWDDLVVRANKGEFTKQQVEWLNGATAEQKWDTAASEAIAGKTRKKITDVVKAQFPKIANKAADIVKGLEEKLSATFLIKATKEEIAAIVARDYNGGKVEKSAGKVAPTNSLRDKAQPRHKLREAATQEDEDDLYDQSGRNESANSVWGGQFTR